MAPFGSFLRPFFTPRAQKITSPRVNKQKIILGPGEKKFFLPIRVKNQSCFFKLEQMTRFFTHIDKKFCFFHLDQVWFFCLLTIRLVIFWAPGVKKGHKKDPNGSIQLRNLTVWQQQSHKFHWNTGTMLPFLSFLH